MLFTLYIINWGLFRPDVGSNLADLPVVNWMQFPRFSTIIRTDEGNTKNAPEI